MKESSKQRIGAGSEEQKEQGERGPEAVSHSGAAGADSAQGGAEQGEHREEPTEKIGLVIDGRYKITGLVGRGGMGSVYRAEHIGIHRTVALKLLHPSLASVPEVSMRFEREAFAVGHIEHPNCVDVSDFGRLDDGSLYLVMEFLEGKSVGDILHFEKRFDPYRALHIMRHVLRGLGHAHSKDIVHRDIKPENIVVVEQDGDPNFAKILDFGIAKLVGQAEAKAGEVKLTQAGVAFGTPVYMSPEQCVGNPIDGRADLYGASVVLYEMLAGKPPFYSEDKLEVLSMHATREVPLLSSVAPESAIPTDIEALVRHGLAKRPNERFSNAAEYIAAIDMIFAMRSSPGDGIGVGYPHSNTNLTAPVIPGHLTTSPSPVVYGRTTPSGIQTGHHPTAPEGRRRLARWLVLGGLVVAAAIALALVFGGNKSEGESGPLAEQAAVRLAAGNPKGAIKLLEKKSDEIAEDAAAQVVLGHAYAATSRYRDALRAYERAVTLDNKLLDADETIRANLKVMLGDRDGAVILDAADILLSKLENSQSEARKMALAKLIGLASEGRRLSTRTRARELAEKHGVLDQVDLVTSYSMDLRQGQHCEDRLEAVVKLRALGDPKAIPDLKKARWRRGSGSHRKQNINACLKDAATEAIKFLEELEAEAKAAEAPDAGVEKPKPKKK